jgi:serine/threonine-protein kinase
VDGESLEEAIHAFHGKDGSALDPGARAVAFRELLGRFIAVCNAMAYAHSRGVLHRDLKPANILLARYGETLVVDWGLAKVAGQSDRLGVPSEEPAPAILSSSNSTGTRFGSVVGTPAYMSPEQAAGRLDLLGPASDIYSLGATLYCLLTGVAPFTDKTLEPLLTKVKRGEFAKPRQIKANVPRPLEAICLKAMSTARENRYETASALADDLEHWLADEPVTAYRERGRERMARWIRRHRALAITSGVALVVIAVVSIAAAMLVNRQRQVAEVAFREARDAVDELFTKVSEDALLNQPGMQGLRKDLLQKTLAYYQRFLEQRANDSSVKEEYAATLFRAGRILDELQSPEQARPNLERARDIQAALVRQSPKDATRLQALADTQNALGRSWHRSQQLDEALAAYKSGCDLRKQLVELSPKDLEYQRMLANSIMNIGLVEKDRGEFDPAGEKLQAAQNLRQELLAAQGDSAKLVRELAMGSYNQGLLDLKMDQPKDAVGHFNEAIERFDQLRRRDPRDLNLAFQLAICYRNSADVQHKEGASAEAARLYKLARDEFARLVDRNPDVREYQSALAGVYMNMAREEEPIAKEASFDAARATMAELVKQYPENPQFRHDLAVVLRELGKLQFDAGKRQTGRKNLQLSVECLEKLVNEFPKEKEFGEELEKSRRALGESKQNSNAPADI